MYKLEKVLVPFINSSSAKQALKVAITLCKLFSSQLFIVHVKTEKSPSDIEKLADTICHEEDQEYTFMTREGNITKEILAAERLINADFIVMGAYGLSGFQQFWVGGNAYKVASASNCPVITMQDMETVNTGIQKILMPIDDSEDTRLKTGYVAALAKAFDAEVLIFCVSRINNEETRAKLAVYGAQVKEKLESEGIKTSFAESYGNNIAEDSIKFANIENCDLIAIMTETENTNSFFMGSYAQQLISTSPVPVMSVHSRSTKIPQGLARS